MGDFEEIAVDEEKIVKAIKMEVPLVMTTYTLPKKVEKYIERVVTLFLEHIKQQYLRDSIIYCVQELVVNAKKANTKRIYFIERGLDLFSRDDYDLGMETFRDDTLNNISYYLKLQQEHGLYVKLILQLKNNIIAIEVRNNSTMTAEELDRVRDRIRTARKYNDIDEAMIQLLDESEGAGLGLAILVLMLKKLGLTEESFDILKTDQETIARIIIPKDIKKTG
jgi:hypothetical protein